MKHLKYLLVGIGFRLLMYIVAVAITQIFNDPYIYIAYVLGIILLETYLLGVGLCALSSKDNE